MQIFKHHLQRLLIAGIALLATGNCYALSFGELEVQTRLNQPLVAVIPVDGTVEELNALIVGLASLEDFDRLNIIRTRIATELEFEVVLTPGLSHIRITSQQSLREPIVEFVMTASWGQGRIIRDFSIFVSP